MKWVETPKEIDAKHGLLKVYFLGILFCPKMFFSLKKKEKKIHFN